MELTFKEVKRIAEETNYTRPILVNVKMLEIEDPDIADLSYLEDSDYEEDQERLQTYGEWWYMVGIQVEAEVMIPHNHHELYFHTQVLKSAGLWGIESDSDDSYKTDVAMEQWDELKSELEMMNIYIPDGMQMENCPTLFAGGI